MSSESTQDPNPPGVFLAKGKYRVITGYKYQLTGMVIINLSFKNTPKPERFAPNYITLHREGVLELRPGYAWDGPSGPTIDTESFMLGALVHDALYQLLRELRAPGFTRKQADEELYKMVRAAGMNWVRAQYVYWFVRAFGWRSI